MRRTVLIPILVVAAGATTTVAVTGVAAFAKQAAADNAAALRARGPAGLQTLLTRYSTEIAAHRADPQKAAAGWPAIEKTLDTVAGQRDAWAAKLYWYTDLDAAKAAAKAQGKPILSLRLLGKLTDEYSCANSRFFRTALYANDAVSKTLREKFILHWQSERPVPVLTIDMGDGRTVKRTLTGNSIHYLLDETGRPLDALPGLYGPGAFARWLGTAEKLASDWEAQPQEARGEWLQKRHRDEITRLAEAYVGPIQNRGNRTKLANDLLDTPLPAPVSTAVQNKMAINTVAPSAVTAGRAAATKMFIEMPLLNVSALYNSPAARVAGDEFQWATMAKAAAADAVLDANSLALMRTKTAQPVVPVTAEAQKQTAFATLPLFVLGSDTPSLKPMAEERPQDVVSGFQKALAFDSVRNEYRLHAPLHAWFAKDAAPADLEALNARVYSELFLTPKNDPWLGLAPAGLYAALPGDGLEGK